MSKNVYFAYRSFWPELETTKKFADAGIATVCFFSSNTFNSFGEPYCLYPPTWYGPDNYDFKPLDHQIGDILSASPEAELICMVDLNTPIWFQRRYQTGSGLDSFTQLGHIIHSPSWVGITANYMQAFLMYAQEHYADRIKAYVLACGRTCEWQDKTQGDESSLREKAFKEWCSGKKYPVPERIPSEEERGSTAHHLLRDPGKDASALRYWKFCSDAIVDTISHFIGKARKTIRSETELGVFYGYIVELGMGRHVSEGHLEYEKLLKTPGLNFLIGPGTYSDREIGGGSGFMVPYATVRNNGCSYLHECDQRTHTYNNKLSEHLSVDYSCWPDEKSTIAGLKREMALCLIKRASMWWFDMWGGFYRGRNVMDAFSSMKRIWDEFIDKDFESSSETMMVLDPESSYYMDGNNALINEFIRGTRNKLNRTGAPYDICSFSDLESLTNLSRYKFFIFPNLFSINSGKLEVLGEKVLKDNRTVLWLFAPGIIDGESYKEERVDEICGCKFGSAGIGETGMGRWKSIYAYNPQDVTPGILKKIMAEAGVHIHCDEEVPVYANTNLLAVHFNLEGKIKINLPGEYRRVVELYKRETAAENTSAFEMDAEGPGTFLFHLEK